MTYYPNYRDFYRRAIIPMGAGHTVFLSQLSLDDDDRLQELTHWFVAIEGSIRSTHPEYFQWKVIVFPSRQDGSYYREIEPYFISKQCDTIDESLDISKEIIRQLKAAQFPLKEA